MADKEFQLSNARTALLTEMAKKLDMTATGAQTIAGLVKFTQIPTAETSPDVNDSSKKFATTEMVQAVKGSIPTGGGSGSYPKIATVQNLDNLITVAQATGARIEAEMTANIAITTARTGSDGIPANLITIPVDGKTFVKSASGAIEFKGKGFPDHVLKGTTPIFEGFAVGDVTFSGATDYPKELSYELWKVASDESFQSRLMRADKSVEGKWCEIIAHPRSMNSTNAELTSYHFLRFMQGDYPNTYNGNAEMAPVMAHPWTKILGAGIDQTFLHESTQPNRQSVIAPIGIDVDMKTIEIGCFTVVGGHSTNDAHQTINTGNAQYAFAHDIKYKECFGYCLVFGIGYDADVMVEFAVAHNIIVEKCQTQAICVFHGRNVDFNGIHLNYRNTQINKFIVPIDIELNNGDVDFLSNVKLRNITVDAEGSTYNPSTFAHITAAIAINPARVGDASKILCENIRILAEGSTAVAEGIKIKFTADAIIRDSELYGRFERGIVIENSTDPLIENVIINKMPNDGNAEANLLLDGVKGAKVRNCNFKTPGFPAHLSKIIERERKAYVTSAANVLSIKPYDLFIGDEFGSVFVPIESWRGQVKYNGAKYEVSSTDPTANPMTVTLATAPGTVAEKDFAPGDVNTTTGVFEIDNHGYNNNAILFYKAGTTAMGGLGGNLVFRVIEKTTDTFKISLTEGGAPFIPTSGGAGVQTFIPMLETAFSDAEFENCDVDTYELVEDGESKILSKPGIPEAMVFTTSPANAIVLTVADTGNTYDDEGSDGIRKVFQLPDAPRDGLCYEFGVTAGEGIKILAGALERILYKGTLTGLGGTLEADEAGSRIQVYSKGGYWRTRRVEADWTTGSWLTSAADVNYASVAMGSRATASSSYDAAHLPDFAINDTLHPGGSFNASGFYWLNGVGSVLADSWLQVDFRTSREIDEAEVIFMTAENSTSDPSAVDTHNGWGLTAFNFQYWTGSAWANVPTVGVVTGNTLARAKLTFPSNITTTKVRVVPVTSGSNTTSYARIVEIRAVRKT
jgi:hypothetical protein